MSKAPKRRLGTIDEACREAMMSRVSLYARIKSGDIKAYKRGFKTLVDLDSITAFNDSLPPWEPTPGHSDKMRKIKAAKRVKTDLIREP